MKVYEHRAPSDHIRFEGFTHAAYDKGDLVVVGAVSGIADISFEADAAIVLDIGIPRAVFRLEVADVAGTPVVGVNIYLNGGAFTTVSGGTTYGVIVDVADGTVAFVKIGG
jgi:hypothetical protein